VQLLVNIDVDDLDRAIDFYTSALDLKCERRLFEGSGLRSGHRLKIDAMR